MRNKWIRRWLQKDWRYWHPENLPLRHQLIVLFLMVGILPAILLGIMVNWTSNQIIERQVTANTMQLINKVNQTLDTYMENMQSITYLISFDRNVDQFLAGQSLNKNDASDTSTYQIRQFLQGFTTVYSEIAGILIVNTKGDYISNELYARYNRSLTQEEWYQQAIKQKGIFTIIGHPSGRNITSHANYGEDEVVTVVRSINDPTTGKVKGVILIDLKLRVIAQAAKDVTLGKTGYLMVTDPSGHVIYAPSDTFMQSIPAKLAASLRQSENVFTEEIQGQQLQFIYRTSSYTGWKTVGVFQFSESVAEARKIRFYIVIFLFCVCFTGLTASYGLASSISRPIYRLSSLMQKAESGDMTSRYISNRRDEVGMLGRSFNRMMNEIRNLISLNQQKEQQKREAELRSLQAHIRPHFLYNTLDTIHWMAQKKGADDVSSMVDALSKLFRIGLSRGSDMITLAEEEQHIVSYLQIQKTRYRDRLQYDIDIQESVHNVYVMKLLLQPIVENAIYHGIKARRGPGKIHISAEQQEDKLVYTISDDGAGFSEERLIQIQHQLAEPLAWIGQQGPEPTGSYGLLNIQARIHLAYGTSYGVQICPRPEGGTTIQVTQPLLWNMPSAWHQKRDQVQ
ncbi:histidine kinase [Paenibacillus sp. CFBP13512]|uniref:cache domain-containing sensor histidine kinase n=1 Tax=Paenibacillus sp. CFBP13512 TaxID=2184007 RepID=UPI0010BFC6EE|nr:sensor histidine kinase [Paenibacillus sp. CFBP13512]TKJ93417.1 histidine kinase [Paenibacillus sp. CFBP13512]